MPEPAIPLRRCRSGARPAKDRTGSEIIAAISRWLRLATGWFCRPRGARALDNLGGHMLRDIGLDPEAPNRDSTVGFWRRR